MSSGLHLTKETFDLIRAIGDSRSKQEEDQIIRNDVEKLQKKTKIPPTDTKTLRELLLRCIYADMLGHNVEFSHFFAVNMCQHKKLSVKRAGYLSCCLLLAEDSDFRMMIVATLQKDLLGSSTYGILIALNTLCKIITIDNLNSFSEIVTRHLGHANPLIAKKAYCVYSKMLQIAPERIQNQDLKLKDAIGHKEVSIMGCSLNIYYHEVCKDPVKYKDMIKIFINIFNKILDVKIPRQYDYARLPAPWMQIKLLQILGKLCKNDKEASEEVYDTVRKSLRRADDTLTGIGFALMYQNIQTITELYPNTSLLNKASSTIGKFFKYDQMMSDKINKSDLRYLGIELIRSMVKINTSYALEHQLEIVQCLEHPDESVKRLTLDLLFKTTNSNNLDFVIKKMLKYLKGTSDPLFRQDLVNKIYDLNEALTPDPEFFTKTTNQLFQLGSDHISNKMLSRTINLIKENLEADYDGEFNQLLINSYFGMLETKLPDQLIKLISWIFGEIAFRFYNEDGSSLKQLLDALLNLLEQNVAEEQTKGVILSAITKIRSCAGFEAVEECQNAIEHSLISSNLEIRQRAYEYQECKKNLKPLCEFEDFDETLSFLRPHIEKSIKMGNGKYDRSKKSDSLLNKLKKKAEEEKSNTLKTTHHKADIKKEEIFGPNAPAQQKQEDPKRDWIKPKDDNKEVIKGKKLEIFSKPIMKKTDDKMFKRLEQEAKNMFSGIDPTAKTSQKKKQPIFKKPSGLGSQKEEKNAPVTAPKKQETSMDLLGGDLISSQEPAPQVRQLKIEQYKIDQPTFEGLWPNFPEEVREEISTKLVTTKSNFEKMTSALNFYIVNSINNDNICALKYGGEVILFYGKYKLAGGLETCVRANRRDLCEMVLKEVRQYCKG